MKKRTIWGLVGLLLGLSGCLKNDTEVERLAENEREIQAYIAKNNLSVQKTASGLYYGITLPSGSSRVPAKGELVTFHYTLRRLMDDVIIDSSRVSRNRPVKLIFGVQGNTEALREGIGLFHLADRGFVLAPSSLGYGAAGGPALLPYSTLRYDFNIFNIQNEDEQIEAYIRDNNLRVDERTESGLRLTYLQRAAAGADTVKATSKPQVRYNLKLLDGTQIDPNPRNSSSLFGELSPDLNTENSVIKGFREALLKLRVGDRVRAIMPSAIGYGTTGTPDGRVLPYSPLMFDIEVISIPK